MDTATADRHTRMYPMGKKVTEGKTKTVYEIKRKPDLVLLVAKDDITAGDGAKHDVMTNKACLATETACNVFEYLKRFDGIPLAFVEQDNVNSFVARACDMLPYEVVVRREAHGSFLKRHPAFARRHLFEVPLVEWYLKTRNRRWKSQILPCDDPLMVYVPEKNEIMLYEPSIPFNAGESFLVLPGDWVFTRAGEPFLFPEMERIARDVFVRLEEAWMAEGCELVDMKVEFGIASDGTLCLADVIDSDSWRIVRDNQYLDKQVYRDGGDLDQVTAIYREVAEITGRFGASP